MSLNLRIINKHNYISILHCKKKMISFYKKYDWYNINKKNVTSDSKKRLNLMILNKKKIKFKKIFFYT